MTFHIDLSEANEDLMLAELSRRLMYRTNGRCDYCGKPTYQPQCKFPERHAKKAGTHREIIIRPARTFDTKGKQIL